MTRNKNTRSAAELEALRHRKGKRNKTSRGLRQDWVATDE